MTQQDCKNKICELLTSSELNETIDSLINTRLVAEMLKEPTLKDYVPRAVLSVAIQSEYDRFRPLSPTGKGAEEELMKNSITMNSITVNGIFVCQAGEERYVYFNRMPRPRTNGKDRYCQYDYHTPDGKLFSTVAPTLEKCREKRDIWLQEQQAP